ncbi:hypothetical protein [Salipiger sp.]|uniref:hypothetical protein n=1 Tax=Salipiger sp. TaxID=2078585 RepID=UPI003A983479
MRSALPTLSLLLTLAAAPLAAQAEEDCASLFTALYAHDAGRDYPVATATTRTAPDGTATVIRTISLARDRHYATLEDGLMMRTMGLEQAVSEDGGETWKVERTLPEGHWETFETLLAKAADTATHVTCTDDVRYYGKTYRKVSADLVVQVPVPNLQVHQDFYLDADGNISATETELTAGSQTAHSVEIVTARGDEVELPAAE